MVDDSTETHMSKPKCKVNDLVAVVRSGNIENLGKFATVTASLGYMAAGTNFFYKGNDCLARSGGYYWWIEAQNEFIIGSQSVKECHATDECLWPIRDNTGEDESLSFVLKTPREEAIDLIT